MRMKERQKSRVNRFGSYFFLLIVLIYIIVGIFNFNLALEAVQNFLAIIKRLAYIMIIVFGAMFLTNLFITPKLIRKFLGPKSGIRGYLTAIISGILVSGPPYVLYPMLGGLKRQGMNNKLLAVFLFNRNVKIPFLPPLIYYFGLEYTIVLSLYIIFFSVINGIIIGYLSKGKTPPYRDGC